MNIIPYEKHHYPLLVKAWKDHEWMPCPRHSLPKAGLIAFDGDVFIAYLGMYIIPDIFGFIEWAVKNIDADKKVSDEALKTMFGMLALTAQTSGCKYLYTVTATEAWKRKLISYGMTLAESSASTFVMPLLGDDISFVKD